jgi:hypothetical protein
MLTNDHLETRVRVRTPDDERRFLLGEIRTQQAVYERAFQSLRIAATNEERRDALGRVTDAERSLQVVHELVCTHNENYSDPTGPQSIDWSPACLPR